MIEYPINLFHHQGEVAEITCPLINGGKSFNTPATVTLTGDLFVVNSQTSTGAITDLVTLERGLKCTFGLSPQGSDVWVFSVVPEGWTENPLLLIRTPIQWNGGSITSVYYYGYPLVVDTLTWAGPWRTLGDLANVPTTGAAVRPLLERRTARRWRVTPPPFRPLGLEIKATGQLRQ